MSELNIITSILLAVLIIDTLLLLSHELYLHYYRPIRILRATYQAGGYKPSYHKYLSLIKASLRYYYKPSLRYILLLTVLIYCLFVLTLDFSSILTRFTE